MINFLKPKPGYPITDRNLNEYISKTYKKFKIEKEKESQLQDFDFLNQGDFKDKKNCSLTSITACINFYTQKQNNVEDIYTKVKKIAYCFLYSPYLVGTLSFTIIGIYKLGLRKYRVYGRQKVGVIKNLGYNKSQIIRTINSGRPVILSMFNDGRHYYRNHTVTIVGYKKLYSEKKELFFLIVNDNWSKEKRYIDYKKLGYISSINYL